ncbi:MAG: zinc-binding dehydrogenase [Nitrososphaeraceae archaeon]
MGGLGSYAIQYAKMLSYESRIVAFGRNESKLELAAEFGADATINIENKKKEDVRDEINSVTNGKGLNVVLDCVGLENTADLGISLLA